MLFFNANDDRTFELDEHGNVKRMGIGPWSMIQPDPKYRPKFKHNIERTDQRRDQ